MRRRFLAGGIVLATLAGCTSDSNGTGPSSGSEASVAVTSTPAAPPTTASPTTVAGSTEPSGPVETSVLEPTTSAPPAPLTGDEISLQELGSFAAPIAITWRASEPGLVYLAEREGTVRRVALDTGEGDVVLDLTSQTTTTAERGLLGIAFDPDGTLLYLSFTDDSGNSEIDEYGVADDGTIDTESRRTVITQDQPYPNHNGGDIAFGPDGLLYFGLGDGGAADDPRRNGLDQSTLLGKLLRIDPSQPSGDLGYSIPADNPLVGVDGARGEIWSWGLRNPWRFSFDRVTGDLWIGDVGQDTWEEVDVVRAADGGGKGLSFGWSAFEGNHRFNRDQPTEGHHPALLEYRHGDEGCSVTGGYVYRGAAIPALAGSYVYGDYCSGKVWGLQVGADGAPVRVELAEVPQLVSFGEDAAGELYAVSLDGPIFRLTPRA